MPYASNDAQNDSRPILPPNTVVSPAQAALGHVISFVRGRSTVTEQRTERLEARLRHREKEIQKYLHDYRDEREHRKHLEQVCNQLQHDLQQLQWQLEVSIRAKEQALKDREEVLISIKKAQEHAFTLLGDAEWEPQEDEVIRRTLNRLEKNCKEWCKRHTYQSLSASAFMKASEEEKEKLLSLWGANFCALDSGLLPGGLDYQEMNSKAPSMILTAWMLDVIYREILSKPLFFIHRRQTGKEDFEEIIEPFGTAAQMEAHNDITQSGGSANVFNLQEYWERLLNELDKCE